MSPPHLPPCTPGSGRASFCHANSPVHHGLICGFCSSGQGFADGFLQIPPRDGHPCRWLTLLAAKRVADLHRPVCARAGRTWNLGRVQNPAEVMPLFLSKLVFRFTYSLRKLSAGFASAARTLCTPTASNPNSSNTPAQASNISTLNGAW